MNQYRGYLYEIEQQGEWYRCFVPITNHTGEWNDKGGARRDAEIEIDQLFRKETKMSDPHDQTFEVHAPETTDSQGYAYSPIVGTVDAPNIDRAVEISNETYGPSHEVGQGGEGEYIVYHGH